MSEYQSKYAIEFQPNSLVILTRTVNAVFLQCFSADKNNGNSYLKKHAN